MDIAQGSACFESKTKYFPFLSALLIRMALRSVDSKNDHASATVMWVVQWFGQSGNSE